MENTGTASAALGQADAKPGGPYVLVVDDERAFARRLALEFEEVGFRTHVAYDGVQALAALENETAPDLIVLDVRMPEMDGLQCLRKLHARQSSTPPVILLTGDTSHRIDAAALVYPGSFVLSKPCSYDTVIRIAMRLLNVEE